MKANFLTTGDTERELRFGTKQERAMKVNIKMTGETDLELKLTATELTLKANGQTTRSMARDF